MKRTAMARKRKQRAPLSTDEGGSSLGDLLRIQGLAPSAPASPVTQVQEPVPTSITLADARRVRLRVEKKGRRGKSITRSDGLPVTLLSEGRRELARHLGVGCSADRDHLIAQGDQRHRIRAYLDARGVTDIVG